MNKVASGSAVPLPEEGAGAHRAALEWHRSLYEGSPFLYLTLDSRGMVLAANASGLQRLGFGPEEWLGRSVYDLFVPEERAEVERIYLSAHEVDGPIYNSKRSLLCKDGSLLVTGIVIHARPGAFGQLAVLNCDLIEVDAVEQEVGRLRQRAQAWERFFSLSLDLLSITGFDGYFRCLNPAWQDVLGYSIEELTAEPFITFVHPDDLQSTLMETRRLLAGADSVGFENRYRCRDGTYKWLWWRAKTSSTEQLVYSVARDITGQKAVEQALRQSERIAHTESAALSELNRLKDDFLSTVSHELRTPLANIKLAVQLLESVNSAAARGRYMQILKSECDREMELVNDLLDLQQLEAGARELCIEPIDLGEWLPHLLAPFHTRAQQKSQSLTTILGPGLPMLETDRAALSRILSELINNACKYTPPHNRIAVEARPLQVESCQSIELEVSNWGVLIPPQARERIFEKFYRLPQGGTSRQQGTGLGLALVRKLLQTLGGTIRVEGDREKTAFVVTLPRTP